MLEDLSGPSPLEDLSGPSPLVNLEFPVSYFGKEASIEHSEVEQEDEDTDFFLLRSSYSTAVLFNGILRGSKSVNFDLPVSYMVEVFLEASIELPEVEQEAEDRSSYLTAVLFNGIFKGARGEGG